MVAVCWDVSCQRMPWVGPLTLMWPLTPCRLHQILWLDELKHFIVYCFGECFHWGLLQMKNARFSVGADVCYVTVYQPFVLLWMSQHPQMDTHFVCVTCYVCMVKLNKCWTVTVSLMARLFHRNLLLSCCDKPVN